MINTLWQGKTVVMVWEHKHIANKKAGKALPPLPSNSTTTFFSLGQQRGLL
jgi:hypothetical protein